MDDDVETGEGLAITVLGCSGSFPGPGEACSGYLVRSPEATVVVDLGPGTLANLQRHTDLAALDALVLSHQHPDHWLDLPILRNAMRYFLGLDGLAVYGTAGTRAAASALIEELEPTLLWSTIDERSELEVGDQRLRFSRTDHPVETLAVRVDTAGRSLVYTADTGPAWSPDDGFADGVDLLVCEATLPTSMEGQIEHLSGRQAGGLARDLGVTHLMITHVSPGLDDTAQRSDAEDALGRSVAVARNGLTLAV